MDAAEPKENDVRKCKPNESNYWLSKVAPPPTEGKTAYEIQPKAAPDHDGDIRSRPGHPDFQCILSLFGFSGIRLRPVTLRRNSCRNNCGNDATAQSEGPLETASARQTARSAREA